MANTDYRTTFLVDESPEEVFAAIANVRGWWSEEIDGDTDRLDAEFDFSYRDIHRSAQRITQFLPGKKVVWLVSRSFLSFAKDSGEWDGTTIVFDISPTSDGTELTFTHVGLAPEIECFNDCSKAWDFFVDDSLRSLIVTGVGKPNHKENRIEESQI